MNRVSLRLDGTRISIEAFLRATKHFVGLLRLVDESVNGTRTIRWTLAGLNYASPATVTSVGEPRSLTEPDTTPRVAMVLLDGFDYLEKQIVHPSFTDTVLAEAGKLSEIRGHGGVVNLALVGTNSQPDQAPRLVHVTQRVAATVTDVLGAKYRALGSVEGRLDVINVHGAPFFSVYERLHGRRVRCVFEPEQLEEAKNALGRLVIVEGELRSNARGHPVSIKVKRFRRIPDRGERPTVADIKGIAPGFTGGIRSDGYVRERWDADQD